MSMDVGFGATGVGQWSMPGEEPSPAVDPLEEILAINELITSGDKE